MANKKEYSKPTVKAVRWNMKEALCNTFCEASPCIIVIDESGANTRIDYRNSYTEGEIGWHDMNDVPSANSWPSGSR